MSEILSYFQFNFFVPLYLVTDVKNFKRVQNTSYNLDQFYCNVVSFAGIVQDMKEQVTREKIEKDIMNTGSRTNSNFKFLPVFFFQVFSIKPEICTKVYLVLLICSQVVELSKSHIYLAQSETKKQVPTLLSIGGKDI